MDEKSSASGPVPVLLVGGDPALGDAIAPVASACDVKERPYNIQTLLVELSPPPVMILCGRPPEGIDSSEVAQLLSIQYLGAALFLVIDQMTKVDRKELLKNGFTDVFMLPMDRKVLKKRIDEVVGSFKNQGKLYKAIKLIDVTPETKLEFGTLIYLPANNKYIQFTAIGDSLSAERANRLKKHQIGSLWISATDSKKFYEYTARQLIKIKSNAKISETERSERLGAAVRQLFGSLFTDASSTTDAGRLIVEEGQKIIKNYITLKSDENWYYRVISISAQSSDTYSHASNTATYAALLAIGLGMEQAEDVAVAGLLHDVGLEKVPETILEKDPERWGYKERELYEKHPEFSIEIIKDKKLILSEMIRNAILQHHERFNGTGFPKQLSGSKICREAQVIAIADRIDEMTTLRPGKPRMSPAGAIKALHEEVTLDPTKMLFDPELLKSVLSLFPRPEEL